MPPKAKNFSICFAHDLYPVSTLAVGTPVYITDHNGNWYLVTFKDAYEFSRAVGWGLFFQVINDEIESVAEYVRKS